MYYIYIENIINEYMKRISAKHINHLNNFDMNLEDTFSEFKKFDSEQLISDFYEAEIIDVHYLITHCYIHKMRNLYATLKFEQKKSFHDLFRNNYFNNQYEPHLRMIHILNLILEIDNLSLFEDFSSYFYNINQSLINNYDYAILVDDLNFFYIYIKNIFIEKAIPTNYKFLIENYVMNQNLLFYYSDYFFTNIIYYILLQKVIYLNDQHFMLFYQNYESIFENLAIDSLFFNLKYVFRIRMMALERDNLFPTFNRLLKHFDKKFKNMLGPDESFASLSFYDHYLLFEYFNEKIFEQFISKS